MTLVQGLTQQLKGEIRVERQNGTKVVLEFAKQDPGLQECARG